MKKAVLVVLSLFIALFCHHIIVRGYADVSVQLTSVFDATNQIEHTPVSKSYGSTFAFDQNIGDEDFGTYEFAFWVVNGTVRKDLAKTHTFTITKQLSLIAVFSSPTEHAVLFMDSNGKLLKTQYVTDEGTASDSGITLPTKPGMVVASTPWKTSSNKTTLDNITEDTVFVLQYTVNTSQEYALRVLNGTASTSPNGTIDITKYQYNTPVTVTAPSTKTFTQDGVEQTRNFHYWMVDDHIASYNQTYEFTMLQDKEVIAVYNVQAEALPTPEPRVNLSFDLALRTGYRTFLSQFNIPTGYSIVEYGLLSSLSTSATLTFGDGDSTHHQANTYYAPTKEFVMSLPDTVGSVAAYVVYKNASEEIVVKQSDTTSYASEMAYYFDFETGNTTNIVDGTYQSTDFTVKNLLTNTFKTFSPFRVTTNTYSLGSRAMVIGPTKCYNTSKSSLCRY